MSELKKAAIPAVPEIKKAIEVKPQIAVEALEKGWYNSCLIKPGQKFVLKDEKHFSANWMKKI